MIVDFEIFNTLKEWNTRLEANKPARIKKVETGIDFVESDKEGDEDNVLKQVTENGFKQLLGKTIKLRTPIFCKNQRICKRCSDGRRRRRAVRGV